MTDERPTWHLSLLTVSAAAALALASCAPDEASPGDDEQGTSVENSDGEVSGGRDDDLTDEATDDAAEQGTDDDGSAGDDESVSESADSTPEATDSPVDSSVYQALETVLGEYPDGVVLSFEDEGSRIEFSIFDGSSEWELDVDASTFEITRSEEEEIDSDDRQEADAVAVDFADVLRAAEAETGAQAESGELDSDHGTVIYEVELTDDAEVAVDAATGEVLTIDN